MTLSPTATPFAAPSTSTTSPAASTPGVNGSGGLSWYSPAAISTSGKLMPAARIATRTSPGFSGADGTSSNAKDSGGPSSRQTTTLGIRPRSPSAAAAPRGSAAGG